VAKELSEVLAKAPEVTDVELYAGTAAPISFNGLVRHYDLRSGSNVADLQVNLLHKSERSTQSHPIAKRLREPLQEIAARYGAAIKVVEVPPGPPVLSTLVAEIYGKTAEERAATAAQVIEVFRTTPDVVDIDWTLEAPQRKLEFAVDREKAALAGVQPVQVTRTLRLALSGETTGLLHLPSEEEAVPITVRVAETQRSSANELADLRVRAASGALVPLSELGHIESSTRDLSRFRKNLRPVVYVTADVAGTSESPVYAILGMRKELERLGIEQLFRDEPRSAEQPAVKWDGEWQITYEVFRDLGAAFGLVLILIYILLIGWFGSFRTPLVMMVAIPLGLVGVLPGHFIFGAFFTATSMIGFIALAGIMVRNSVLLIDFVDQAQKQGATLGEAVVAAGAIRLRPILLTAGTVVVGAIVILFDPIFQGLAIALMFGALASTALTLVVVPVLHFLSESRGADEPLPEHWTKPATEES
jgi:multidrug efflux pump subunit AcrB